MKRRIRKDEERLEALEEDLYRQIRKHLLSESRGGKSMYLVRQSRGLTTRSYCDLATDKAERLEQECLRIRERLGLPTHLGPFAILKEYARL